MEPLHLTHLFLIALWGGVVLAESVIEFTVRDDVTERHAARLHYLIDLFIEGPLLIGVLVTGGMLLSQVPVFTPLHMVKITAGLLAILVNFHCMALVILRERKADDPVALRRYGRKVRIAWLAIPLGLVALVIGLGYFRG